MRALYQKGDPKMTMRSLAALAALALACGCSGSGQKAIQFSDARINAVFLAPGGVACIVLVATSPTRSATKSISVSPGANTVTLSFPSIPTGHVMFSGVAYNTPCGAVDSTTVPSWVADDVTAAVTAAATASVQLNFHGNGSATVGGNFTGDAYTVTTIAGLGNTAGSADGPATAAARFQGP